jgi:hypothetical protein
VGIRKNFYYNNFIDPSAYVGLRDDLFAPHGLFRLVGGGNKLSIALSGIVTPKKKTSDGVLVRVVSLVFADVIKSLAEDWNRAFEISPVKWEEIIVGAFDKAGFDEVVLTPRSGDHGRDVIAIKNGFGSIKITCSRPSKLSTVVACH